MFDYFTMMLSDGTTSQLFSEPLTTPTRCQITPAHTTHNHHGLLTEQHSTFS